jgi:hypothetical protein
MRYTRETMLFVEKKNCKGTVNRKTAERIQTVIFSIRGAENMTV